MAEEKVGVEFFAKTANLTRNLATATTSIVKVKNNIQDLAIKVENITRKIARRSLALGASLGVGLGISAKGAADFETDMRNVNSLLGLSEHKFAALNDQVLKLATQMPESAGNLAKSAYNIVSSGFDQPAEIGLVNEASVRAAKAGLTTTDIAAKAIVTTLNAYGLAATDATRVSDALFQTVNKGQVEFEGLAINLGDFVGIASASGAKMEDAMGLYAKITIATGQVSQSATSVNAIFRTMINQTDEMTAALEKNYGSMNIQAIIAKEGLIPVLRTLYKETGGNATALQRMFPNVEATKGMLALFAGGIEEAAEFMKDFSDEARIAGVTAQTLGRQSKSVSYTMAQLKSTLGALRIQFGQAFLPALKMIASGLGTMARLMTSMPQGAKTLLSWIVALNAGVLLLGGAFLLLKLKSFLLFKAFHLLFGTKAGIFFGNLLGRIPILNNALGHMALKLFAAQGALKGLGLAIGGWAAATAVALPIVNALFNRLHPQDIDRTALALQNVGEVLNKEFLDKRYGENFSDIAKNLRNLDPGNALDRINRKLVDTLDRPWTIIPFFNEKEADKAKKQIDELDKALVAMHEGGDERKAAEQFNTVTTALRSQGVTVEQIEKAFNDYNKTMDGAALAAGSEAAREREKQKALELTTAKYEAATEARQKYQTERISPAMEMAKESMGLKGVTSSFDKARTAAKALVDHQKESRDIAKDVKRAEEGITEAIKDRERTIREANLSKMKAEKKLNRQKYITGNMAPVGSDAWIEQQELQMEIEDADKSIADANKGVLSAREQLIEATQRQAEANQKLADSQDELKMSVADVANTLEQQIKDFDKFYENLTSLASQGIPITYLDELKGMGPEGRTMAQALVDASPADRARIKRMAELAAERQTEAYTRKLDIGMVTAAAQAAKGAAAGVDAILREVNRLAPGIDVTTAEVKTALNNLALSFGPGLELPDWLKKAWGWPDLPAGMAPSTPVNTSASTSLGPAPAPTLAAAPPKAPSYGGWRGWAKGGVDTQAHIQGSPTILYGERETGGEAFVPKKGSKDRAQSTLETAAGWYGMQVIPMARGGFVDRAGRRMSTGRRPGGRWVARAQPFDQDGVPDLDRATREAFERQYNETIRMMNWYDDRENEPEVMRKRDWAATIPRAIFGNEIERTIEKFERWENIKARARIIPEDVKYLRGLKRTATRPDSIVSDLGKPQVQEKYTQGKKLVAQSVRSVAKDAGKEIAGTAARTGGRALVGMGAQAAVKVAMRGRQLPRWTRGVAKVASAPMKLGEAIISGQASNQARFNKKNTRWIDRRARQMGAGENEVNAHRVARGMSWLPPRPPRVMGASMGKGGVSSTTNKKNVQTFGDVYMADLTQLLRYADQKKRLGALQGADDG